jgi:hypothetical protein
LSYEQPNFNFPDTENAFLLFLAGCSALNDNKNQISEKDIIKAYKTHYKLLSTDISKLVDRLLEEKSKTANNGYLVCDKCNEYYKLQPDESADDFIDKCECGGKLKYTKKNRMYFLTKKRKIYDFYNVFKLFISIDPIALAILSGSSER